MHAAQEMGEAEADAWKERNAEANAWTSKIFHFW